MACDLTKGFLLECLEGVGGAKELFIVNWEDVSGGITFDATTGEIDDLPVATLYRYQPLRNSITFTDTGTQSVENGTVFYAQSLVARLSGMDAIKRKELEILGRAKVAVFIRLFNDKIVMMGRTDGAFASINWQSGAAKGDFSGPEITFTAEERVPAEYLEAYTSLPFDNFPDITVSPAYTVVS